MHQHTWDYCGLCCRPMVRCGKCGNNCCNAMYGEIDGKQCDTCPSAYEMQESQIPPEFSEEYKKQKIDANDKFWAELKLLEKENSSE